jgi:outer membrane lipoprotein-sorting protein
MKDGTAFVTSICNEISNWHDYSCESELLLYHPDKTTKSGCKLFYKEHQLRIEVIGGGYRNGTVLVRDKEGKTTAQGGILLGHMKTTLDPDSRVLIMANGVNVMKSDLPDVMSDMKDRLNHGSVCRVSVKPTADPETGQPVYIVTLSDSGKNNLPSKQFFVDAEKKIPVRIDLYRDGKRVSTARFKDMRINDGLSDGLFHV